MSEVGFAVFGCGRAGAIHVGNLRSISRAKLICAVDTDLERAKKNLKEFGDVKIVHYDDADAEVFKNPAVTAVIIGSPTFTHQEILMRALEAGKPVFCEKPLSKSYEGTVECLEKAEATGVPLMVAFQRRFDPSFAELKVRLDAGEIGDVHFLRSTARDNPIPSTDYLKISGGLFHDCIIHDIDMLLWLTGSKPVEVFTMANSFYEEIGALDDVDTAVVQVRFENGAIGVIDVSRSAKYGYDQRLEVFGRKGMVEAKNQRPSSVVVSTDSGCAESVIHFSFPTRYAAAYKLEMEHFVRVLLDGEKLSITKDQVLLALRLCDAAEKSHKVGTKLVLDESATA